MDEKRKGRDQTHLTRENAQRYLDWLLAHADTDGVVRLELQHIAAELWYSRDTIKRYEKYLSNAGVIKRHRGYVVLLRHTLD